VRNALRDELDTEARRRKAMPPRPGLEALERDLRELLDRADISLNPAKRDVIELLLLGVGTLLEAGKRDVRPDEDVEVRQRMKEIAQEGVEQ